MVPSTMDFEQGRANEYVCMMVWLPRFKEWELIIPSVLWDWAHWLLS